MKIFLLLFLCLTLYKECTASNSTGNQDENDLLWPFGISLNMEKLNVFEDGISKVTKRGNVTFSKPSAWLFGSNEVKMDMMYQDFGDKNKYESWDFSLTDVENSQSIGGLKLTRDLDTYPWFRIEKSNEILLNILGADVRLRVTQNPQTPNQMVLTSAISYGDQVVKMNASYSVDGNVPVLAIYVDGQTWTGKAVLKGDDGKYYNRKYYKYGDTYHFEEIDINLHLKEKDLRLELNIVPIGKLLHLRANYRFSFKLIGSQAMILYGGYTEYNGFYANYIKDWQICSMEMYTGGPRSPIFELKTKCNGRENLLLNVDAPDHSRRHSSPYWDVRISYEGAEVAKGLVNLILMSWREYTHVELNLIENFPNVTHGFSGGINVTLDFDEMVGNLNITFDGGQRFNERMALLFEIDMGRNCWQINFQDFKRQIALTSAVTGFGFPLISQSWEEHHLWLQKQFFFSLEMPEVKRLYIWPYHLDGMKIFWDTTGFSIIEFNGLSYRIAPLSMSNGQWELELKEHNKNNDTDTFRIVYDGQTVTGNGTISNGYSSYPLSFHHDSVGDVKRGSLLLTRSRGSYLFQLESAYANSKQLEIFYVQDQECEKGKILLGFDELGEFVLEHRSPICPWGPPDREEQSWRFSLSTNYKAEPDGYDNLLNSKLKLNDKLDTSLKLHALGHLEGTQLHDSFSSDFYNAPESVLRPLLSMLKDFVLDLLSSYIDYKDSTNYNYNDYDPYYDRS